ncbi:L-histidine Nalpha-methyltransferase / hercynylcysteine S-oxide synthase, partial [Phenoliferia sp. Uapishka_3]
MRTTTQPATFPHNHQSPATFIRPNSASAPKATPAQTPLPPPHILDLRGSDLSFSLKDELIKGLADGQPRVVPGDTPEDEQFAYTRTIDTLCLYSDAGLEIYEKITELGEYYVFPAELEILREYGSEIACRMFGEPSELLTEDYLERMDGGSNGDKDPPYAPTPAASAGARKEKWGDGAVGVNNNGVNGSISSPKSRSGIAIELGSGSLAKTKHLLRPLAKLLKVSHEGVPAFKSIEYKALDVEKNSLVETLGKLVEKEPESVTSVHDGTPRVVVGGIAATYDEGLEHFKASSSSDDESKSLVWLGSSVGNFTRPDAASFLRKIATNVLTSGDTMLIGIDNCADGDKIRTAYDDPKGVTRSFIFEGINHAGRSLHGGLGGNGGLASKNFKYISRWNAQIGRHEVKSSCPKARVSLNEFCEQAYVQCKVDNLVIPLEGQGTVTLKKNEMVRIEVSYKYTQLEALALFDAAGLRLVQQWTDSRRLHSIYLIEKPAFHFPLHASLGVAPAINPYGLPSLHEWETMWKTWDTITLGIIPRELLMKKPIPLRGLGPSASPSVFARLINRAGHIILFYLGHIPAFAGIHLCRYFGEAPIEPAQFADIFERGIDPDIADPTQINHWHSQVPEKADEWPSLEKIIAYQERVRERIRKVYTQPVEAMSMRLARVMFMIYEHEAMHAETLVYIALQASNSLVPAPGFQVPDFKSLSSSWDRLVAVEGASRRAVIPFGATTVKIGHNDAETADADAKYDASHEFGWDVENPEREVAVDGFKITALPVSNGEYLAWLESAGASLGASLIPCSWELDGTTATAETVRVKTLYGEVPLDYAKHWPVSASATQLLAFAKAKNGRLPTQAELAVFHRHSPVDSAMGNVGFQNFHPVPPTVPHMQRDGSVGFGSDGGVWMWTSDVLAPHDGFSPSTIYPGYSSDFHDGTHLIVVGGSYVTPPRLARRTFVNFYQAGYPYVVAGARIAYD